MSPEESLAAHMKAWKTYAKAGLLESLLGFPISIPSAEDVHATRHPAPPSPLAALGTAFDKAINKLARQRRKDMQEAL